MRGREDLVGPIKKVFAKRLKPASPPNPQVQVGEPADNETSDDNDRDNDSFQWQGHSNPATFSAPQ